MNGRSVSILFLVAALTPLAVTPVFTQIKEVERDEIGAAAPSYERTVEMVELKNAAPRQIEEALKTISRNWNLFPSLQFLACPIPDVGKDVLFLRGYDDEVAPARRVAEFLDGFYPAPSAGISLFRMPLDHISAPAMRLMLLAVSDKAGLGWTPDGFLVFPPGYKGSLFFRGTAAGAKEAREIKEELDRPRYGSIVDMLAGFWGAFRRDLSAHFLAVATYVVSALLLILLHFLLIKLPWLGKRYERCFTLIWTKVLDNVKGRDFAFEVLKSIAATAVESAEQSFRGEVKRDLQAAGVVRPEVKKARAVAIARELMVYRGFNPDDLQVKRVIDNLIEAKVYGLDGTTHSSRTFKKPGGRSTED